MIGPDAVNVDALMIATDVPHNDQVRVRRILKVIRRVRGDRAQQEAEIAIMRMHRESNVSILDAADLCLRALRGQAGHLVDAYLDQQRKADDEDAAMNRHDRRKMAKQYRGKS